MEVKILTEKKDMLPLQSLIQQLNPAVTYERMDALLDDMISHGYRIVAVYEDSICVGLSGIWVTSKLYSGKYLEMDNVVVNQASRSKGIGQFLTDYILEMAKTEGCETVMLDAYLENEKAHAFYERIGFVRRGYHFLLKL